VRRVIDLAAANERLAAASPREILEHAVEQFGDGLLFTSSFGAQSGVLLHLWSEVARSLPVVFLDTGFIFPETLAYRDDLAARLGLTLRTIHPDIANAAFVERYGADIQQKDADFCCGVNKVAPLAGLREAATAWVSGLRRDQSATRADTQLFERDGHLVRVHPLAAMTRAEVAAYLAKHAIPEHPLTARRYLSIGCVPCTRAALDGEDERAGRWSGTSKTECGLHLRPGPSEAVR
jgi:phosphoadenosine phosphosulfate reductase